MDEIVTEIDPVYNIRGYIYLECLAYGAPLVGDAYDKALQVPGRDGSQGKHMLLDYVLLPVVQVEVTGSIVVGRFGMGEAVEMVSLRLLMPVVKEIVVEQGAPHEASPVHLLTEGALNGNGIDEAVLGHGNGMLEDRGGTVLDIVLHILGFLGQDDITTV